MAKNWTIFTKCFSYHKVFRTQLLPFFFCLWIFGWYVIRIDLELTLCIYAVNCWLFWLMLHVIFLTKSVRKVCVAWRPKKCNNVVVIMISFFIFFRPLLFGKMVFQNHTSHVFPACPKKIYTLQRRKIPSFVVTIIRTKESLQQMKTVNYTSLKVVTALGKWDIKVEHKNSISRFISFLNGENFRNLR